MTGECDVDMDAFVCLTQFVYVVVSGTAAITGCQ